MVESSQKFGGEFPEEGTPWKGLDDLGPRRLGVRQACDAERLFPTIPTLDVTGAASMKWAGYVCLRKDTRGGGQSGCYLHALPQTVTGGTGVPCGDPSSVTTTTTTTVLKSYSDFPLEYS